MSYRTKFLVRWEYEISNQILNSYAEINFQLYTAVAVRKTWVLHKPIKNLPTLAYKNIVRKCYEDMFFITNIHFNNPTSMPQT